MLLSRSLFCAGLFFFRICFSSEVDGKTTSDVANEQTTEAVMKAVEQAEDKPEGTSVASLLESDKEKKEDKEATAVAKAATEVLDTETLAAEVVPERVMEKASTDAKKTYKDLSEGGVNSKAAADAAAKVAVATVDGASDLTLPSEAKKNAEKAAVAAGEAVADHPDSQDSALVEALSNVKKEERTEGKVDLKEKPKGVVQKAEAAATKPLKLAKGAVEGIAKGAAGAVEPLAQGAGTAGTLFMMMGVIGIGMGAKYYYDNFVVSPGGSSKSHMYYDENAPPSTSQVFIQKLQSIRQDFSASTPACKPDIETQYASFDDYSGFSEMR